MMTDVEMTDDEVRQQVERTGRFIAAFRELIASTVVDPASPCEAACLRGLERIAVTVDAVDYGTFANLATIDAVMRGGILSVIEVQLMCVGAGPTLDFADATAFLGRAPAGDRHSAGAAAQLTLEGIPLDFGMPWVRWVWITVASRQIGPPLSFHHLYQVV